MSRGHWSRPGRDLARHRGYARHLPGFRKGGHGFHRHGLHGYGHRAYGFFPHATWLWPTSDTSADPTVIVEQGDAPPYPVLTGIPSLTDLPASTGIRSAPAASPAVYVLGSGKRSVRPGGAKILPMDPGESESEAPGSGPRIIRLHVPRGR